MCIKSNGSKTVSHTCVLLIRLKKETQTNKQTNKQKTQNNRPATPTKKATQKQKQNKRKHVFPVLNASSTNIIFVLILPQSDQSSGFIAIFYEISTFKMKRKKD